VFATSDALSHLKRPNGRSCQGKGLAGDCPGLVDVMGRSKPPARALWVRGKPSTAVGDQRPGSSPGQRRVAAPPSGKGCRDSSEGLPLKSCVSGSAVTWLAESCEAKRTASTRVRSSTVEQSALTRLMRVRFPPVPLRLVGLRARGLAGTPAAGEGMPSPGLITYTDREWSWMAVSHRLGHVVIEVAPR
jgi:hypothetical protein